MSGLIFCFLLLIYVMMVLVIYFVEDLDKKCNEIIRLLKKKEE